MKFSFIFLVLALCLTATSFGQEAADVQKGYLVGPGDILSIKVLSEKDFDLEEVTVDEDGRFTIPYVEEPIIAKCRTERELQAEVIKRWSKFLRNPQVSLRVTKRNSRPPVSVYGEVRQPQQVILTRRAHLLELLSFAGGVTDKSAGMIQIFRTRPPVCTDATVEAAWKSTTAPGLDVPSQIYSVAALRQGREEANPEIMPGDIIVVPKAAPVYVTGEVIKPGELDMPEGGLPLTQAIAMASGISREAKTKDVKIFRRKPGGQQPDVIAVNYDRIRKGQEKDPMLEPFDIVVVDKAKKSIGDILIETLTNAPNRIPIPIP
jgi:protein involved in polysaccharide export with SLBB domain